MSIPITQSFSKLSKINFAMAEADNDNIIKLKRYYVLLNNGKLCM